VPGIVKVRNIRPSDTGSGSSKARDQAGALTLMRLLFVRELFRHRSGLSAAYVAEGQEE
jgi:hypothetical protein